MPNERSAPQSPRCPGCAQIMRLASTTSRFRACTHTARPGGLGWPPITNSFVNQSLGSLTKSLQSRRHGRVESGRFSSREPGPDLCPPPPEPRLRFGADTLLNGERAAMVFKIEQPWHTHRALKISVLLSRAEQHLTMSYEYTA